MHASPVDASFPLSDSELIKRAQDGDQAAFAQIYDRYAQPLYRYIYCRVGDPDLAEDVRADVFLRAFRVSTATKIVVGPCLPGSIASRAIARSMSFVAAACGKPCRWRAGAAHVMDLIVKSMCVSTVRKCDASFTT